jgi:hypothetical protein
MPSMDDQLYALAEWLRTTPLVEFSLWISNRPLSMVMGSKFLTIPLLQTIHILAIATAFGSVLMMNLRVLGVSGTNLTLRETTQRYQPWVWAALLTLVATGVGLIIAEPVRELINPIFWVKMTMLVALVLLSIAFQAGLRVTMAGQDMRPAGPVIRIGAIGLILLWCAVIVAGRWIAYAPA